MLTALTEKMISGACLDVIDGEWLTKKELENHKLVSYAKKNNNLLIVPHIGGSTVESLVGARIFIAKKVVKFLESI